MFWVLWLTRRRLRRRSSAPSDGGAEPTGHLLWKFAGAAEPGPAPLLLLLRLQTQQGACWHGAAGSGEPVRGAPVGMAREDAVRCLRCLLYALNLLFWVRTFY